MAATLAAIIIDASDLFGAIHERFITLVLSLKLKAKLQARAS